MVASSTPDEVEVSPVRTFAMDIRRRPAQVGLPPAIVQITRYPLHPVQGVRSRPWHLPASGPDLRTQARGANCAQDRTWHAWPGSIYNAATTRTARQTPGPNLSIDSEVTLGCGSRGTAPRTPTQPEGVRTAPAHSANTRANPIRTTRPTSRALACTARATIGILRPAAGREITQRRDRNPAVRCRQLDNDRRY